MAVDVEENHILLTEDMSPQDIAILSLILAYAQTNNKYDTGSLGITLYQLILYKPLLNSNQEIIVIPNALDICDKVTEDIQKYSLFDTEAQLQETIDVIKHKFLNEMWKIDSVEMLDNTVMEIIKYLSDHNAVTYDNLEEITGSQTIKFSPRSKIGNFIQKIVASLHLLHFDELFLLFEAFVSYREHTRELFKSLGGTIKDPKKPKPVSGKESVVAKTEKEDEELYLSLKNKLDNVLESDISFPKDLKKNHKINILPISKYNIQVLLNNQIKIMETHGLRPPKRLHDIMKLMTTNSSNIYLVQNSNLSSIPSYYYIKYLECLQELDYQGSFKALHQYFDYMVSNNSKYFYHFALISRAALHQYFGEDEKALDAIEEAISVARENGDNSTLSYILSWLFNFMRNKPELWSIQNFYHNNNELHLLDFLVKKSKTVSLLLYSMSYHFEALHIIDNRGSMNRYIESLYKATYVSIHDNLQSFIKSMEMASVIWSRIGNSNLSDLFSDTVLEFIGLSGKKTDEISMRIRRSYLTYYKGNTEEGYSTLEKLKEEVGHDMSLNRSLNIRRIIMLIKINLNKGRIRKAEKIMEILDSDDIHDIELRTDLVYLNAEVQTAMGNYSNALDSISKYLSSIEAQPSQTKSNIYTIMRLNLLKCQIFNLSGNHVGAISLIIQQLEQAKRVGFLSIVTEGIVIFASILNNMESYVDAYNVLHPKMVAILQVNNKEVTSMAFYELSKSCYNLIKKPELCDRLGFNSKEAFNKFLRFLNTSIQGFKQTINPVMLQKCFELERQVAIFKSYTDLLEHSETALENLKIRKIEEINHGFIN